jgi:hypothetical protein
MWPLFNQQDQTLHQCRGQPILANKYSPIPYASILREAINVFESVEGQLKNCLKQPGLYVK